MRLGTQVCISQASSPRELPTRQRSYRELDPRMTHWIVGDIHGCARELETLIERLKLGSGDQLISVGDLFHRGPDPVGVMEILQSHACPFVLGNHELAVLKRCGLAPRTIDASDRPPLRTAFPDLDADDLAGDGGQSCTVERERRADILRFLQTHSGFAIESRTIEGAQRTPDGREWLVVHAGIAEAEVERNSIQTLTAVRRTRAAGRPWWYESYGGPRLVLFGHTPSRLPRAWRAGGKLVALGLDTGCVYGGSLTAYAPALDEIVSVPALSEYARAS